ncbi:S8 family serine peptidase [Agrobacterium vitis]|nr:S8 family serine peptidase [Agrobacterium vitis]MUP13145.1 S8 family serine peptidase [Agrobacterium vitis]
MRLGSGARMSKLIAFGRPLTWILLFVVSALGTSHQARADNGSQLLLRATSAVPDSVISYIADISEPQPALMPPGVRPETFLAGICGVLTNTYIDKLQHLNPSMVVLAPAAKPRLVQLPACLKWSRNAKVLTSEGETLDDVLIRAIGRPSGAILKPCDAAEQSSRCNNSLMDIVAKANPGIGLGGVLKTGTVLTLPITTQWTTVTISAASKVSPSDAAAEINRLTGAAIDAAQNNAGEFAPIIVNRAAVEGIDLIHALDAKSPLVDTPGCSDAGQIGGKWPFDAAQITATLKANMDEQSGDAETQSTIVVLDTGITADGFKFLKRVSKANTQEVPGNYKDDDHNQFVDDVYGIDTSLVGNDLAPYNTYEDAEHGTEVAKLAVGVLGKAELDHTVRKFLRLKFVKAVHQNIADKSFQIPESALNEGAVYAALSGDILNISIGTPQPLPSFSEVILRHSNLLVVAAAGNNPQALEAAPNYPANYGGFGALRDQLITVGASDGRGGLAHFSDFSKRYVDIVAPGCALPYHSSSGDISVSGTSFAAPLVSFTSGLLRSLGLSSPRAVKDRLMMSVDYDPKLARFVLDGGRLNIVKALGVRKNILQLEDGTLREVSPVNVGPMQFCGDELPVDLGSIRKVTSYILGGDRHIRVLFSDADGQLSQQECVPGDAVLTISDSDGNPKTLSWDEFQDFIPASIFPAAAAAN